MPLEPASSATAALPRVQADFLLHRRRPIAHAHQHPPPPPPPLYRTRWPPPPPPPPHRDKIKTMYVGIFYHVCRLIEAMYVGNVDRSILLFKRVVLDHCFDYLYALITVSEILVLFKRVPSTTTTISCSCLVIALITCMLLLLLVKYLYGCITHCIPSTATTI
jgi:hypothetical protein